MLHPLPFTTFGEIAGLGLKAVVYCSGCYKHRSIDPAAEHLRDRCFATTRFRCTRIRYTGNVCGCLGSVEIEPAVLLPVGGETTLAFLYCSTCLPSWEINHVPIDRPPWSVVNREGNDRFKCPGCGKAVAWRIHGPTWRPSAADCRGTLPVRWGVDAVKLILVALTVLVSLMTPLAQAQTQSSANEIIPGCRNFIALARSPIKVDDPMLAGICAGQVGALISVGLILEPGYRFCVPPEVTRGQAIEVVLKWLDKNPERWHRGFNSLALTALLEAWPCR